MEDYSQAGSSPAASPTSSGAASAGSVVVAVVALLALLDAAVETLWSGSPLRLWVAALGFAFVALSLRRVALPTQAP